MKGLMMKEFYLLNKYCRACLLIAVVFTACSAVSTNLFTMFYPAVLGGIIPVTLLSCDEKSKWSVYVKTFPYTRKEIVSSKYLITLIYLAAVVFLTVVSQEINMLRATGGFQTQTCLSVVMPLLATGLIVPGILLPAVFKLGVDKGRMVYYVVIVIICGLFGALRVLTDLDRIKIARGQNVWFFPVLLGAAVVLFVISWMLSVKFYQEREL